MTTGMASPSVPLLLPSQLRAAPAWPSEPSADVDLAPIGADDSDAGRKGGGMWGHLVGGRGGGHKRDTHRTSGYSAPFTPSGSLSRAGNLACGAQGLCGQGGIDHEACEQVSGGCISQRAVGAVCLAASPPFPSSASVVPWVRVTAFLASRPALGHLALLSGLTCTPLPGPTWCLASRSLLLLTSPTFLPIPESPLVTSPAWLSLAPSEILPPPGSPLRLFLQASLPSRCCVVGMGRGRCQVRAARS